MKDGPAKSSIPRASGATLDAMIQHYSPNGDNPSYSTWDALRELRDLRKVLIAIDRHINPYACQSCADVLCELDSLPKAAPKETKIKANGKTWIVKRYVEY